MKYEHLNFIIHNYETKPQHISNKYKIVGKYAREKSAIGKNARGKNVKGYLEKMP